MSIAPLASAGCDQHPSWSSTMVWRAGEKAVGIFYTSFTVQKATAGKQVIAQPFIMEIFHSQRPGVGGVGIMAAQPAFAVEAWTRWETTLTSSTTYSNPYANVTLDVIYTSPSGKKYHTYGFWDGGNIFNCVLCSHQKSATWRWMTTCSDTTNTGLHGQGGTVAVTAYISCNNPLYPNGYLKVSAKRALSAHHGRQTVSLVGRYRLDGADCRIALVGLIDSRRAARMGKLHPKAQKAKIQRHSSPLKTRLGESDDG